MENAGNVRTIYNEIHLMKKEALHSSTVFFDCSAIFQSRIKKFSFIILLILHSSIPPLSKIGRGVILEMSQLPFGQERKLICCHNKLKDISVKFLMHHVFNNLN